jgi:hypothetical protein
VTGDSNNYYYYYYLLQLSFHSVAAVLTLLQTKQIRVNVRKETVHKHSKTIQNTVNTRTLVTKTPTQLSKHAHPHITKQVITATVQATHQMKYSQYNQVPSV